LKRYIENDCFWRSEVPAAGRYFRFANRDYFDWAEGMGLRAGHAPLILQLYVEPLQKFRLAADGHGGERPVAAHEPAGDGVEEGAQLGLAALRAQHHPVGHRGRAQARGRPVGDLPEGRVEVVHGGEAPGGVLGGAALGEGPEGAYARHAGEGLLLVGHSLGGATAAAATRSACCTDARIAADVLVAPAVGLVESVFETTLSTAGPATLVVNVTLDTAIPVEVSRAWWATLESPAAFLAVPGAHHSDLIENSGDPSPFLDPTERASIGFFDAFLGGDRGALDTAFAGLREEGYEPLGP
jgi:hypothetical protein